MRLTNKVALITGGTSGIGRATALLFAEEGAKVAITGRNRERGEQVVAEIEERGSTGIFVQADVCLAADCKRSVEETVATFGQLDVLFNNAGGYVANNAVDCSEEEFDMQVDSSLKGSFLMCKYTLPHMIKAGGGAVVNNSSGWGYVGGERAVAYCAAKGGMIAMTKAMAIDHGPQGIRVNCICTGDTVTPMEYEDAKNQGMTWEEYVAGASNRPLRRMGEPIEIARSVLFLASEDASFITGAALPVDGGGVAG